MSPKDRALAIAAALAAVEDEGDSENTQELHAQLRRGLYENAAALGLSAADIAEIDNHGPLARGGEPKPAAE